MDEPLKAALAQCPFLQPTLPIGRRETAIGIYCRLPGGRVRIPTRDEVKRFCVPQAWRDCPVYQAYARAD